MRASRHTSTTKMGGGRGASTCRQARCMRAGRLDTGVPAPMSAQATRAGCAVLTGGRGVAGRGGSLGAGLQWVAGDGLAVDRWGRVAVGRGGRGGGGSLGVGVAVGRWGRGGSGSLGQGVLPQAICGLALRRVGGTGQWHAATWAGGFRSARNGTAVGGPDWWQLPCRKLAWGVFGSGGQVRGRDRTRFEPHWPLALVDSGLPASLRPVHR